MLRYGRFFAWSVLLKEIEERYARRDVCNTSFRFNAFAQQLLTLSFTSKCASDQLWCKPICNTTADVYAYWGSYCGLQVKRLMHLTERPPGWAWNSSDKWIWKCDILSPNESAKLLLVALSENCLHSRSPEIKRLRYALKKKRYYLGIFLNMGGGGSSQIPKLL